MSRFQFFTAKTLQKEKKKLTEADTQHKTLNQEHASSETKAYHLTKEKQTPLEHQPTKHKNRREKNILTKSKIGLHKWS